MTQRVYDIQIRSLRGAVEHLGMIDLTELRERATVHGTAEDRALIDAIMALIDVLPPGHRHHR